MLRLIRLGLVKLDRADGGLFREELTQLMEGDNLLVLKETFAFGFFLFMNIFLMFVLARAKLRLTGATAFVVDRASEPCAG